MLETSDLKSPIPLDAAQLLYLVQKEYVDYPALTKEDINDKNKADGLARSDTQSRGGQKKRDTPPAWRCSALPKNSELT